MGSPFLLRVRAPGPRRRDSSRATAWALRTRRSRLAADPHAPLRRTHLRARRHGAEDRSPETRGAPDRPACPGACSSRSRRRPPAAAKSAGLTCIDLNVALIASEARLRFWRGPPLLRLEDEPPTGPSDCGNQISRRERLLKFPHRTPEEFQQPRVPVFRWIHFVTLNAEMTSKEWSPPPVVTSSFSKKQLWGKGKGPFGRCLP